MLQNNSGYFSSIPPVTKNIIIINLIIWLADALLSSKGIYLSKNLGLYYVLSDSFKPHQIFTYMFMHGGFSHVFFNMFAIFMFGRTLETVWGAKKFLIYYILTGVGAALTQEIVYTITYSDLIFNTPEIINTTKGILSRQEVLNLLPATVGASGAVFGVLVAFGMLFPNVELIMFPIFIPIKAKWFVIGYGVLELFLGISNNPADNVAHFAHLGGFITGLIILLIWKRNARRNGRYF